MVLTEHVLALTKFFNCKAVDSIFFFLLAVKVVNFNTLQPAPDAMSSGGMSHSMHGGSVGLTQRGADVAELLEKQARNRHFITAK